MKTFLNNIGWLALIVLLIVAFTMPSNAQIGNGRLYSWDVDTLTNADTLTMTFFKDLEDEYNFTWQVSCDSISGTTSVTAYVQERFGQDGQWVNVDTLSFTAGGSVFSTGSNKATQQRLYVLSDGTQSSGLKATVWYRRKKS